MKKNYLKIRNDGEVKVIDVKLNNEKQKEFVKLKKKKLISLRRKKHFTV